MEEKYPKQPERKPISEELARENRAIFKEAAELAIGREDGTTLDTVHEARQEIDAKSLADKILNPLTWRKDRSWAESYDEIKAKHEDLKKKAEQYLPEIHGEALNYVQAYEAYVRAGSILQAELGVTDVDMLDMEEFIRQIDRTLDVAIQLRDGRTYTHVGTGELPKDETERTEFFQKQGEFVAAKEFFLPRLPINTETLTVNAGDIFRPDSWHKEQRTYDYSSFPGLNYYRAPAGARFPRLEIFQVVGKESSLDKNFSPGLKLVTDLSLFRGYDHEQERRLYFLPLSEKATEIIKGMESQLNYSAFTDILGGDRNRFGNPMWNAHGRVSFEFQLSSAELDRVAGQDLNVKAA